MPNRNNDDKLYPPSTFQTSDIEPLRRKIETIYISLTHPSVTILRLYTIEQHNCLILTSRMFQSRNIAAMLENNNLSYTSQN